MKDNLNDIEKMFRESFETFESDVDPSVWSNISNQIGGQSAGPDASTSGTSSAGSTASSAGVAGLGAGKIALIVGAAGVISFGAYQLFSDDDSQAVEEKAQVEEVIRPDENMAAASYESNENVIVNRSESVSEKEEIQIPVEEKGSIENKVGSQNSTIIEQASIASTQPVSQEAIAEDNSQSVKKTDIKVEAKEETAEKVTKPEKALVTAQNKEQLEEKETSISFEASIYASVIEGKQPLEVYFENRGSIASDVKWKFRDGDESLEESTSHVFEESGEYWVVLEIRDENGHFSKDSTKITVEGKAYLDIPNIFTPNGDGHNDTYKVNGEYIKTFEGVILDRNQNVLFRWNDMNESWDGKDRNGNTVPKGTVCFYVIKAIDMDGNMLKPKRGTITIF